jgi:hypothetical protein
VKSESDKPELRQMEQLNDERITLQRRINALQEVIAEKYEKPEKLKNVGKCFRFRNSYGGDRDKWWLYTTILGIGSWDYHCLSVQTDCDGKTEIEERNTDPTRTDGHIPITRKEFEAALSGALLKFKQLSIRVTEIKGRAK